MAWTFLCTGVSSLFYTTPMPCYLPHCVKKGVRVMVRVKVVGVERREEAFHCQ